MTELPENSDHASARPQPQWQPQGQPLPQGQATPAAGGYPQGYPGGTQFPPQTPPMNVFAIIGFVGVFFVGLVGVILGHIALGQIKRTGESGRGFALAATIIGYVRVAGELLAVILFLTALGLFGALASGSTVAEGHTSSSQLSSGRVPSGHTSDSDTPSAAPWNVAAVAPLAAAR